MTAIKNHTGIWIASLIWLVCIAAAFTAALVKDTSFSTLWPLAVIAIIPALLSMMLSPFLRREWAQILVLFAWIALAIMACLAFKFIPMAILFLCAPAMAALFEREKVVETMVIAAIVAGFLYYFEHYGGGSSLSLSDASLSNWGALAGIGATIGLLIATLYGASAQRPVPAAVFSEDMLSAVPGGILQVGPDNRLKSANDVAVAQLQLADDVVGIAADDIFMETNQRKELMHIIERARKENRKISRKFRLGLSSGEFQTAEFTAGPLGGQDILLHVYDSTSHEAKIRDLNLAFSATQKDAEGKTLFFAGVSHELRTPLNAIIGFSDMMRSRLFGPLPGKYAEYADLIHDSGQHMLDLIGDVLDLSKVEAGKYELVYNHFDAADVIRSSAKMLRPAADSSELQLDVEIRSEQGELLVEADRKALRQIILNLLSNAIKFTPKGGRVMVFGDVDATHLQIGVVDNGAGMSSKELEAVGKPYHQTDSGKSNEARGSGLGLSLVKSLSELHGGDFTIKSRKGFGTTAEITIPLRRH